MVVGDRALKLNPVILSILKAVSSPLELLQKFCKNVTYSIIPLNNVANLSKARSCIIVICHDVLLCLLIIYDYKN